MRTFLFAAPNRPFEESTSMRHHKFVSKAAFTALGIIWSNIALSQGAAVAPSVQAVKAEQTPWGTAGDAKSVQRSIDVRMSDDMRFSPDHIKVKVGETIRFVLKNDGRQLHEFVIGTRKRLDEHAASMLKHPGMAHEESYMAHVAPGKTGVVVWTFNRAGEFNFACLIAGHYQAGMVGSITVVSK